MQKSQTKPSRFRNHEAPALSPTSPKAARCPTRAATQVWQASWALSRGSTRRTPPAEVAATGRTIPRTRALRRKAGVRISAVPSSSSLALSPKLSSAPTPNGATRATIAFLESDRPDGREPTMPMPRPQSSRRHWRTAASARRCRSRAARGGRHPPRYCFLCGIGPRPPGRSNRLALTVRVIGLRGKERRRNATPGPLRHYRFLRRRLPAST